MGYDFTLSSDEAFYTGLDKKRNESFQKLNDRLEVLDDVRKYEAIELAVYRASHYANYQ